MITGKYQKIERHEANETANETCDNFVQYEWLSAQ